MKHATTAVALALLLAGCGGMGTMQSGPQAVAQLEPTKGNAAKGTVRFQQQGNTVQVMAELSGLAPNQQHGFHVHEKGDCSSGDGMSAGGHFNPDGKPHGPQNAPHHSGDMPGLVADGGGNSKGMFVLEDVTVAPGPKSVVGRGLIVHKDPDDYKTQPTGNAGARLACAVIRAA